MPLHRPRDIEDIEVVPEYQLAPKVRCYRCNAFLRRSNEWRGTCDACQRRIDKAILK